MSRNRKYKARQRARTAGLAADGSSAEGKFLSRRDTPAEAIKTFSAARFERDEKKAKEVEERSEELLSRIWKAQEKLDQKLAAMSPVDV